MVAVDENGKAKEIQPLNPTEAEDIRRFKDAEMRKKIRLENSKKK